jgi:cephalosporin-C deacetylase-like acetyl esterase
MRKTCLFAVLMISTAFMVLSAEQIIAVAKIDHPDAIYKLGETAKFDIKLKQGKTKIKTGKIKVKLTLDGGKLIKEKEFDLAKNPEVVITGKLTEPGFLRCTVEFYRQGQVKRLGTPASAGFAPEKIRPGAPIPEDFWKFWEDARAKLAKEVSPDLKLTKVREDGVNTYYKISVANFDNTRTYGFLSVPKEKGKYPVLAEVPPAGGGYWSNISYNGTLRLMVNVFHQEFDKNNSYQKLNKKTWYFYQGIPDREKYYYYKSILGVARMLDCLTKRPDCNGNIIMSGRSQGGGFALIMAGLLCDKVIAAAAEVPALCDHNGFNAGRQGGWPQMARTPAAKKMAAYYDVANFATRIKCPVLVSVGLIDTMCVPSSVYAAYSQIKSPKKIFNGIKSGHGWGEVMHEFNAYHTQWLKKQVLNKK